MAIGLSEAAAATGVNRSTIYRAWKAGRLSATRTSTTAFEPAYVRLLRSGELADRARQSRHQMENCDLCARYCRVNRLRSIRGAVCRTGERAVVYSAGPHHGEEDCLRGWRGSGTIFFSRCNLRCVYCQNWEISWQGEGQEASDEELAKMMLTLRALVMIVARGAANCVT